MTRSMTAWRHIALVSSGMLLVPMLIPGQAPAMPALSSLAPAHAIGVSATRETHPPTTTRQSLARYDQLPLRFEPNRGQTDPRVRFLARGSNDTLFLTASEAVLTLVRPRTCGDNPLDDAARAQTGPVTTPPRRDALTRSNIAGLCSTPATAGTAILRWRFLNANPRPSVVGQERLPGVSSYLIGRDPRHWRRAIPGYARVVYHGLYPGVDLVYYGQQGGQVEYDLVLAPGADPRRVRLAVQGTTRAPRLDGAGNLLLPLAGGTLVQQRPTVYQEVGGVRRAVAARYVLEGTRGTTLGFAVGAYDHRQPLVLDPVLVYSTYLGGSGGGTAGNSIAIDGAGHVYITGVTSSHDFPTNRHGALGGAQDAFVAEFDPSTSGTASLLYSTYLGGSGTDFGSAIAVDPTCTSGCHAFVTGTTSSSDFPSTTSAYSRTLAGAADTFVAEVSADGSTLLYSTLLGGSASNIPGSAARTGSSGIAVDAAGHAYVTGDTLSLDFPTTTTAYSRTVTGVLAAYVAEIDPTAPGTASLRYSTLFGTNDTFGIAVPPGCASDCRAAVAGTAFSDLPTTPNAYSANAGCSTAFMSEFNPAAAGPASLDYSSCLGGDDANGIAMDTAGHVYVAGDVSYDSFPTTTNAYSSTLTGVQDAFVSELDTRQSGTASLRYSTYFGGGVSMRSGGKTYNAVTTASGVAVDGGGHIYLTGTTDTTDFPTTPTAYVRAPRVRIDNIFVSELDPAAGSDGLLYSTYLSPYGSYDTDVATGIAVDPRCAGGCRSYVTGNTESADFPTTPNAYARTLPSGDGSAFMSEVDTGMSGPASLAYSTFLGGSGGANIATSIAVDGAGHAYVAGQVASADFPTTSGAYARTSGSPYGNAFVAETSADGQSLLYSTYLGGSGVSGPAAWTFGDAGAGIALTPGCTSTCNLYVAGSTYSTNFPTTTTAYSSTLSGSEDAFVSEIDPSKSGTDGLLYSTYLGGSGANGAGGITVDPAGRAFVTGFTFSADFPTTMDACSRTLSGSEEGFVVEIDPSASGSASLRSSTYLGGGPATGVTYGDGIAVDGSDHVYVTGYTASASLPTSTGAFSSTLTDVDGTAFVAAYDFGSTAPGPPAPGSCTSGGPGTSKSIAVQPGWNLISLPLQPAGTLRASDLLAGLLRANATSTLVALFALNGIQWSRPLIARAGQPSLGTDFPLAVGTGYLLYSDQANSYIEQGSVPAAGPTWALGQGWNLVGLSAASPAGLTAEGVLAGVLASGGGGQVAALFRLAGDGWSRPLIARAGQPSLGIDFPLVVGVGYLLYTDHAASYTPDAATRQGTAPRSGAGEDSDDPPPPSLPSPMVASDGP